MHIVQQEWLHLSQPHIRYEIVNYRPNLVSVPESVRCRPSLLAVSSLPEPDPTNSSILFGFSFPLAAEMLTTKVTPSTVHTTRHQIGHISTVLVMKTGIILLVMKSSILICIATTLLPGPWISYLNLIMIPADSEKWWKDLSPIFIFVAFSIVLVSVGTLWPTSLRSFAALPRALNYIPFFECSRVSRCSISSLVSGTGLLSFKFPP